MMAILCLPQKTIAISAGERLYTRWNYRPMFDKMAADYIQPDISHAGGIMELKKLLQKQKADIFRLHRIIRQVLLQMLQHFSLLQHALISKFLKSCILMLNGEKMLQMKVLNIKTVISLFQTNRVLALKLMKKNA